MKDTVRITFVGDLMCQKEQTSAARNRHGDLQYVDTFAHVGPLFKDSDYVIANLETPLAPEPLGYTSETFRFNTPEPFLHAVQMAGVDFVSTANNHSLDRGVSGLIETLKCLDRNKMDHSGAYLTRCDSEEIFVKEIGGLKIAILSFAYGTNSEYYGEPLSVDEEWRLDLLRKSPGRDRTQSGRVSFRSKLLGKIPLRVKVALSALRGKTQRRAPDFVADNVHPSEIGLVENEAYVERARAKILRARESADLVVVLPHIGGQYNPAPGEYTKWTVQWMADLGADVIIANHPHVPLGCSVLSGGCLAAYSLGNFCFNPSDGCFVPGQLADYGIVLHLELSKTTKQVLHCSFEVVKNVVEADGLAVVYPVKQLIDDELDIVRRERLTLEREAVVNRFQGAVTVLSGDQHSCTLRSEA